MGEIAARLADVLVVTDDNPRTEDPATIRAALLAGASRRDLPRWSRWATGARRSPRRSGWPRAGDIVLVAGKGHETGQEVGSVSCSPSTIGWSSRELLAPRPAGAG